jgi:hypothetical protein
LEVVADYRGQRIGFSHGEGDAPQFPAKDLVHGA